MSKKYYVILFIMFILVSGCAPFTRSDQVLRESGIDLSQENKIGQTFVSNYDGLYSIDLYIKPPQIKDGEILLHLRRYPGSIKDITTSSLAVESIQNPGFYRFEFPVLRDSNQSEYYFYIEHTGQQNIRLRIAPGGTYTNGSLYENHQPVEGQLTFRTVYEPAGIFKGLVNEGFSWCKYLFFAFIVFVLPGLGLLSFLWKESKSFSWIEIISVAIGLSIAIYPILFLWAKTLHVKAGFYIFIFPAGISLFYLLNKYKPWKISKYHFPQISNLSLVPFLIPELLILVFIMVVRFWVIRALGYPLWGDSYQHTLITQLIVENRGLFDDWKPYADLITFTYHFGFHAASAIFHWVSGIEVQKSVLWVGQFFNIFAVLTLFPLAKKTAKTRWAGITTMLIVGLFLPMPMFYLNWGRYTQLTGQVILPITIFLTWKYLDQDTHNKGLGFLVTLSWVGLILSHYRVAIIGAAFFLAYILIKVRITSLKSVFIKTLWFGSGSLLLIFPWFYHLLYSRLMEILSKQLTTPAVEVAIATQQYNAIGDLSSYLPMIFWILLPLAIGWGLWKKSTGVALLSLWWFFVLISANPTWLQLPGSGSISNFTIFITSYIPVGILEGVVLGWIIETLFSYNLSNSKLYTYMRFEVLHQKRFIQLGLILGIVIILGWGALNRVKDIHSQGYGFVTRPDINAAAWIKENIPLNARFLVNAFFAFNNTVVVGADSGWWLPFLAKRQTMLPPLNYNMETGPAPGYRTWINELIADINSTDFTDPTLLNEMKEREITHVFIGQLQGRVNNPGPIFALPENFINNPYFKNIYHQDRVWIFEICYDAQCSN